MKKPTKKCKNPECQDAILDYKSSKKTYCNDRCRNRAGYLKRAAENYEFELVKKHTKLNYLALKKCYDKNILEIDIKTLKLLEFNIDYLANPKLYKIKDELINVFYVKEIEFYYSKKEQKIIIIKN